MAWRRGGHCTPCPVSKSRMWIQRRPSTASRMAWFAVRWQNLMKGVTWLSMRYADCMASESGWEKVGEDEEIRVCRVRRRERAREKR